MKRIVRSVLACLLLLKRKEKPILLIKTRHVDFKGVLPSAVNINQPWKYMNMINDKDFGWFWHSEASTAKRQTVILKYILLPSLFLAASAMTELNH